MIGRTAVSVTCLVLLLGIASAPCLSQQSQPAGPGEYPSPARFEKAVREFEAADQKQPPPSGAIVCIGSSSMRGWHSAIEEDLAPLTVIPRGFGGSNMNDALQYADRIVIPYRPRAIVLYEGDNDIEQRIPPEKVVATFRAFVGKVHKHLPDARIYVLSIKPSIRRWQSWPQAKEANRLIAEACAKDKRLVYVDVASPMLDADGQPCKDLFQKDNLHMTRPGYVVWRDVLRPVLLKAELPFEPRPAATQPAP
jgi:lysophospholipase L1-like esterase